MKLYITESNKRLQVSTTSRMTAAEAETLLDGVFEPVLGSPGTDGYVLSSTAAGVRSWVEGGGGASDVGDLTTTSGSSTNMLRVAAAGGLEYRTAAQVLGDIGAAPTASPTFTGTVTLPTTVASVIKPASDSTTALQLANAAGTAVVTVDTTAGGRIGVGGTTADSSVVFYGYRSSVAVAELSAGSFAEFRQKVGAVDFRMGSSSSFAYFQTYSNHVMQFNVNNSTVAMRIDTSGRVFFGGTTAATAAIDIAASTTSAASLRIRSGTAPTTPNAGDIWYDGTNLFFYNGSTTYTIDMTST